MGILRERHKEGEKKPTRYYSKKQETTVAKSLGGKTTKNSGATLFQKGDLTLDNWLIEAKTKTSHSESMSIKKEWLEKNLSESLFMGKKHNALVFNFGPDEPNYYIIDENLFKDLVYYLDNISEDD